MKRVRMLLRVSSGQQLEADGDLSVQRQLITDYISKQSSWQLENKEYFEGSNSGYKNSVDSRNTLQEALNDAQNHEYDILVAYKDDRIGRRMWEMGTYVMTLKKYGVDIYTVKDGCISPEKDDIMGQMMLALRYGNAQKSSSDTGMRVKDTAEKLVQKGKFMGGTAPYGYTLVLSGEISKHGRALHTLQILPEQAQTVKHIYHLSLHKKYGSARIAKELNQIPYFQSLAPNQFWRSGTITGILTNPIYAGYIAYKRRELIAGKCQRNNRQAWILADTPNPDLQIIDFSFWEQVQYQRNCRAQKYASKNSAVPDLNLPAHNVITTPLIDVIHCGHCGKKLVHKTRYSYWNIKGSQEKRQKKTPVYYCPITQTGVPHPVTSPYRALDIEPLVMEILAECIQKLLKNESIKNEISFLLQQTYHLMEKELKNFENELSKIQQGISVMEQHIPDAITGNYPLSLKELATALSDQRTLALQKQNLISQKKLNLQQTKLAMEDYTSQPQLASLNWKHLVLLADPTTQHLLVNRLIQRIEIKKEQLDIYFKVNPYAPTSNL